MLTIQEMYCDFKADPIDIGHDAPVLSWTLKADRPKDKQTAFQIQVTSREDGTLLWDTGRVETAKQRVIYAGCPIAPDHTAVWRLCVWNGDGEPANEKTALWQRGMDPENWRAQWIGLDRGREAYDPSVPYFCADDFEKGVNHPFLPPPVLLRNDFRTHGKPTSARLYVTALGLTRVWINGREAFPNRLLPGVCDFRKRVYGFVFDVSELIVHGENAIGAVLADGWYAGYIGLNPRQWWGSKPRLRLELHLTYADGSRRTVQTDPAWKCTTGPWLYADILHGCGYDARLEKENWQLPGALTGDWEAPDVGAERDVPVFMHPGVPVLEGEPIQPTGTKQLNDDERIIDFGKCFSGVVRITVRGHANDRVDLYHAEELTRDGQELFYFGNRSAQCHDCCILKDGQPFAFQPAFTYHGFRYAKITGLKNAELLSVEGIPISSLWDGETELTTAHPVLNDALRLIRNTRQCNMVDIVTDVCARDERLGWGCEGDLFMHTAASLGNAALFLRKWLQDALDGQREDGSFWAIAPAVMMRDIEPFAGDLQSDIALHCCWLLMTHYDDTQSVRRAYPALKRYLDYQTRNSDRYIRFATGRDWLDLTHGGRSDLDHGYGTCDPGLLGTAWFAMDIRMMIELAEYLGLTDDAEAFRELYRRVRKAFRTFFLGRDHLLRGGTQGGYLIAVTAGLLEAEDCAAAKAWIQKDMEKRGGITWGTATTPVALHGLEKLGMAQEAATFLCRDAFPSIGYMARCGGTTVWERWDTILDGDFHPHAMNAFSHVGLATVGEWIVSRLAGILPVSPGYERVKIAPVFSREIGQVSASYLCPCGRISVSWRCAEEGTTCDIELPAGCAGEVVLPVKPGEMLCCDGEAVCTEERVSVLPGKHHLQIVPAGRFSHE